MTKVFWNELKRITTIAGFLSDPDASRNPRFWYFLYGTDIDRVENFITYPDPGRSGGNDSPNDFLELRIADGIAQRRTELLDRIRYYRWVIRQLNLPIAPFPPLDGTVERIDFSIVIPTYNRCAMLRRVLVAIVNQEGISCRSYEVLIVDDGSRDDTAAIVRVFVAERKNALPRIRYLRLPENRGVSHARNCGIRAARGRFICFTDDDCMPPSDWLLRFRDALDRYPEVAGVGGWYQADHDTLYGRYILWRSLRYYGRDAYEREMKSYDDIMLPAGNTANICYRREALWQVGGFNTVFRKPSMEDFELKKRIMDAGYALLYMPLLIPHLKRHDLRHFMYYNLIRGWASYLCFRLHPAHARGLHFTLKNTVRLVRYEITEIMQSPACSGSRLQFAILAIAANALRFVGKYAILLQEPIALAAYVRTIAIEESPHPPRETRT